ncbi:hypothetical protein I601_1807 [Nocardioides dokdonensis FR1436]|uniref:Uncharacterized protein n=1 Tax=Nocardioides dokdonensis FR1436 TaxID=1300347 RepID=A0A1A9GIZ9_9ACTN|nr:hypothetical protein [Nocardioides dokdonensis]ANH38238.1 hypothetical protein I601_1807 [Nocardioides dokdonensis FR1436]
MSRPRKPSRPYRSVASQMTPAHHVALEAFQAAELRGDWAGALRHYRRIPMFRDATHGEQLELLATLGDDAPGWLVARWLTELARRHDDDRDRQRRAFELGMAVAHPHGVDLDALDLEHPQQATPQLWARDWVVRQVQVYELHALEDLLCPHCPPIDFSPDLLGRAGRIVDWRYAPMGGYRLGPLEEHRTLVDARTGAALEVLDLGLGEQAPEDAHVLGRVVPIDEEPGLALEWRPLVVDEATATAVAGKPPGWLEILSTRIASGRLPSGLTLQAESSISADLPHRSWVALLGRDPERRLDQRPGTLVGQAVAVALRMVRDDPGGALARRHTIAELLLDPHLNADRLARFATSAHLDTWMTLREMVPAHARGRCEEMSLWCDAAGDQAG